MQYSQFCEINSIELIKPINNSSSNNWLNAIIFKNINERNEFIEDAISSNIGVRPIWQLMSELPMYKKCLNDDLKNSKFLSERVVALPSSVPKSEFFRFKK